ncbi:MAG: hypothetical protein GXO72_03445 [Caldiserica bacterium]|nr:hypothetical protein [Caldisericota bacterium]
MLWELCPGQLVAVAKAWEAELWRTGERLRLLYELRRSPVGRTSRHGIPFASIGLRPSRA